MKVGAGPNLINAKVRLARRVVLAGKPQLSGRKTVINGTFSPPGS